MSETDTERDWEWKLVYTKVHCEAWSDANLRRQGFAVLFPRIRVRDRLAPLFPRYIFVGHHPGRDIGAIRNTLGVRGLVQFADHPVKVPQDVIAEIRSRMNAVGIVHLPDSAPARPLFDRRERQRLYALTKFAAAGFRVRAA